MSKKKELTDARPGRSCIRSASPEECEVALFINSLRGGGAERVCVNLANWLVREGVAIELVVLNLDRAVCAEDLDSRVKLVVLGHDHARNSAFSLARYLRRARPATLLAFNEQIALLLNLVRRFLEYRPRLLVRVISNLDAKQRFEWSLWHKHFARPLATSVLKRADGLIAQSQGMADWLCARFGIPRGRVTVIHNPVSEHVLAARSNAPPPRVAERKRLLYVGRLAPEKGMTSLVQLFSSCKARVPELEFTIAGSGPLEGWLKEELTRRDLLGSVSLEGYRRNIGDYYLSHSLTVLTSEYEGFPNALVESIALGTPVVSFDCPFGPAEIVIQGRNGWLVPQGAIDAMVTVIQEALEHPPDRADVMDTAARFLPESIWPAYVRLLCPGVAPATRRVNGAGAPSGHGMPSDQ